MAVEIERKFLLKDQSWREIAEQGKSYCQGYLSEAGPGSVRVRIEGSQAKLNIKSATLNMSRLEYEYDIPVIDAREMLDSVCIKPLIEKTRYHVWFAGKCWEVDEFIGENQGLIVAEIELENEQEALTLPDWVGEEVTADPRYYNVSLVKHPYKDWL
jgi:adenylate cyclase